MATDMPESESHLYVHLVWATVNRLPLLADDFRESVYACISAECRKVHAIVFALNGMDDHVHLLVRIPSSLSVAGLAKQVKGGSSHWIRHEGGHDGFAWQEGYGAFTISRWDVPKLRQYVECQEQHHAEGTAKPALEPAPVENTEQVGLSRHDVP